MKREYYLEDGLNGQKIICFKEGDRVWAVPEDPANSDYQAYLAWVEENK